MTKLSKKAHRKDEHLALATAQYQPEQANNFDLLRLERRALPEASVQADILQTEVFGQEISAPIYLNAITGGSPRGTQINHDLALVAQEQNIPLALGSASIVASEPATIASFAIAREVNPEGVIYVNVNPDTPLPTIQELIKVIQPQAVQIHVNAVQELVMPEGDRDFHWLAKLIKIRDAVALPVIIKEVGFGFDLESLQLLAQNQFEYVDVAGAGGTNFAWIENFRRPLRNFGYLDELGISTVDSLLNARETKLKVFASGGIRQPLDMLKSLVLGAQSVGLSNRYLQELLNNGVSGLNQMIATDKEQLAGLLALFGVQDLAAVTKINWHYQK